MHRRPPASTVGPIVAFLLLLLGGCAGNELRLPKSAPAEATERTSSTTSSSTPTTTTDPNGPTTSTVPDSGLAWEPEDIEWSPCDEDEDFDCATLSVPLDWADVSGDRIEPALARQPASGKRKGALLTNPGGPGASGIDLVFGNPFSPDVTKAFDIVGWDPRGVGDSTHLTCGDNVETFLSQDADPDDANEQRRLDDAAKAVADECKTSDPKLLADMGTDDVARDLEAIRLALGDQPLNYAGFSYGTYIGLRYAELFPTHIRAMMLDGVLDPTQRLTDWLAGQAQAMDASLTRAFESCKQPRCPVDDLAAAYDQVRAAVEQSPLPTDQGRPLGPAELATAAVYASYDKESWSALGPAIANALDGDGTDLMDLAEGYYDFGGYTAYAGVECVDSAHPNGAEEYQAFARRLQEISPRFGGSIANELLPCAFWPVPASDHSGPVRAEGSPPILVLGNRGDAATPYANSVRVATDLAQGHLVSYDGEGHTSYGRDDCVTDVADRYLIRLETPESDPGC